MYFLGLPFNFIASEVQPPKSWGIIMQETWRYLALSVTKYNPTFRDKDGVFSKNEWTSIHDVGKHFGKAMLTLEEYLRVEDSYVKAAHIFCEYNAISSFNLKSKEYFALTEKDRTDPNFVPLKSIYQHIVDVNSILTLELSDAIRLVLREYMWFELIDMRDNNNAIRFGYDYYMYFNCEKTLEPIRQPIQDLGLYLW